MPDRIPAERCENCGGTGRMPYPYGSRPSPDCPDCAGVGYVVPQVTLRQAFYDGWYWATENKRDTIGDDEQQAEARLEAQERYPEGR